MKTKGAISDATLRNSNPESFFLVATFVLCFFPKLLHSQQSMVVDTVFDLKEITITDKRPRKPEQTLQPMQRLTMKELEVIPAQTNADYVKLFSGVTLKDYGGIGGLKTINVRSLGANHTAVIVDGIQLSDAASGQIDLGKIPSGDFTEITLHVGQSTDKLRTARSLAAASLVEFQSSEPSTQKIAELSCGIRSGSFNLIRPFSHLQWNASPKLNFRLSSMYEKANGKYPYKVNYGPSLDSIYQRQNSDIETINLSAAANFKPNTSKKIELQTFFYSSHRGLPGAVILYQPNSNQRLWNQDLTANLRFKNEDTTKTYQQQAIAKYSYSFLRYLDPDFLNSAGEIDNRYTQHEFYASNVFDFSIGENIKTSLAADYQINQLATNLPEWTNPYRHTLLGAHSLRLNIKKVEISESILFSGIYDIRNNNKRWLTKFSPTLMMGYTFSDKYPAKIKILYKNIFRPPTFNDLYYTLVGNPSLKPENTSQFNMNFCIQPHFNSRRSFSCTVDIFYNRVTDKIIAIPTKNLFEWSMQNIGKVEIKGLTLQSTFNFTFTKYISLDLIGNYTFQQSYDITTPGSSTYRNQIPYVPFETATMQSALHIQNFTIATTSMFTGFRYNMAENLYENMLPHWLTHDMAIVWNIPVKQNSLNLKLDITNITNQHYEVIRSFPMPGRAYFFTLEFKI